VIARPGEKGGTKNPLKRRRRKEVWGREAALIAKRQGEVSSRIALHQRPGDFKLANSEEAIQKTV